MPRVSAVSAQAIRGAFSVWLRQALDETGMTLGALAYPTRPHVAAEGTEISYSNLKKFLTAQSAPSLPTVLRIVEIISRTGRLKRSMLTALVASYPEALVRVVNGLDVIGLDTYWHFRHTQPQLQRQVARTRKNRRLGLRGLRALPQPGEQRWWEKPPPRRLINWVRELTKQPDLLAICVAYAFFCPVEGDTASLAMLHVFEQFDESRESLYWQALRRYPEFNPHREMFAGPELHQAECLMAQHSMVLLDRKALASNLFEMWASGHASEFVEAVPLLEWVDQDTVRGSLGIG